MTTTPGSRPPATTPDGATTPARRITGVPYLDALIAEGRAVLPTERRKMSAEPPARTPEEIDRIFAESVR